MQKYEIIATQSGTIDPAFVRFWRKWQNLTIKRFSASNDFEAIHIFYSKMNKHLKLVNLVEGRGGRIALIRIDKTNIEEFLNILK